MKQVQSLLDYLGVNSNKFIHRQFKKNNFEEHQDYLVVYAKDQTFKLDKESKWLLDFRYCSIHTDSYGSKYVQLKVYGKRVFLHNALMQPPIGYVVDHINGDSLDCRKQNLRIVKPSDNMLNKKTYKNSKHRGVSKQGNKYIARIQVNNKPIYLGRFTTLEEAIQVRDKAEIQYFSEMRREGRIC